MIKSVFNEDIQVLYVIYEGIISADDIFKHTQYISGNNELPRKLKILTDAGNATYNFDPDTIYEMAKLQEQILSKYEYIMNAFIHSKPKETAYSVMIEMEQKHPNYFHRVFSTKEAAIDWLTLPVF